MSSPLFDPDAAAAPGSGIFGLPFSPDEARVVLVPVPFEATVSYRGGTADGPRAILEASRQVDLFDVETGHPWREGVAMLEEPLDVRAWSEAAQAAAEPIIERGGAGEDKDLLGRLTLVNEVGERLNGWVRRTVEEWLDLDRLVGVIGGDHSVPFGAIAAQADRHPGLGVLHVDAHADLRDAYEGFTWSHASIMRNVCERLPVGRLVQVGLRDLGEAEHRYAEESGGRVIAHHDTVLAGRMLDGVAWSRLVDEIIAGLPERVYLSVDIDGLDPSLCPHTGTPVPGGLSFQQVNMLIAAVARTRRIVGFDLCEVAPGPESEWDGLVAARLLYKMIGWSLRSAAR